MLTRVDIERIAEIARERNLWVFSDEAYEDVLFDGEHVSIGSLPGMYERTIPMFTFSKSYAMTGVRLGYLAVKDEKVRDRCKKILLYTTSNVCSIVQFGGSRRGRRGNVLAEKEQRHGNIGERRPGSFTRQRLATSTTRS